MKNPKKFWIAVATLVGTIIGAGILGLPYVIAQAGFWTGVLDIILLGSIVLLLYLYLGEVVLRTKGLHQLPGYAEKYLGKLGKKLMVFAMFFGNYGALIAYIIGVGSATAAIFGGFSMFGLSPSLFYSLIFFIVVAFIILVGLKAVGNSELLMLPLIIGIVLFIAAASFGKIDIINLTSFNIFKILIPYGVILFAFLGASSIPVLREQLVNNEKQIKKAIFIGVLIPIISYLIFAVAVVGVTGSSTTEVATIGLGESIGMYMILIGNFLAIITMTTSFLTLGLALKESYNYDYKLNQNIAWALTCFPPLIIALSGFTTFVKIIGLSGVIAGGLEGVLITLMALKAKKKGSRKPEYKVPINWMVTAGLIAVFVFGAGYYLWSLV
ncbi:GerAB/ArcD/ProY family transporter [Candidatus Woesearchaeota archaeon]|nr:GerAB/ArcD/ProY family transporter [Candidatus Woesearchaeota archaeon]